MEFNEYQMAAISIHAPARGATLDPYGVVIISKISIHAPARGATRRDPKIVLSNR